MGNYLCVDYLYLQQAKVSLENNGFENKTLNYISGIGILVILMDIMSCHIFVNNNSSIIFKELEF